jgi:hypothetical protein
MKESIHSQTPLEEWILKHAAAGHGKVFFRINGDIPTRDGNQEIFFEVPEHGKRVLVLHPCHLTPVATLCYEHGFVLVQIL